MEHGRQRLIVVTGASGQDGLILTKALCLRGEHVVAIGSEESKHNHMEEIVPAAHWIYSDSTYRLPLGEIKSKPTQIFHFAGASSVQNSWQTPSQTIIRNVSIDSQVIEFAIKSGANLLLSGSSEMFPKQSGVVSERDPLKPSSPYGVSKATAFELAGLLRDEGNLQVTNLIMFNHESPLRKPHFLTKKLSTQILEVAAGNRSKISVYNKSSAKDFSWAADFIRAMLSKKIADSNEDFVLASGQSTSVSELAQAGLDLLGLDAPILEENDSPSFAAPNPVGDSSKAEKVLGFTRTNGGREMMRKMIALEMRASELNSLETQKLVVEQMAEEALSASSAQ